MGVIEGGIRLIIDSEQNRLPSGFLVLLKIWRTYPKHCLVITLFLFFATMGEGLSILSLLPLMGILIGDNVTDSVATDFIAGILGFLSLDVTISSLLLLMVAGALLKAGLMVLAGRQVGIATAQVGADMRSSVIQNMLAARWSYLLRQPVGRLGNAISSEVPRAGSAFLAAGQLFAAIIRVLIYLSIAFLVSWEVTCFAFVIGAAMMIVLRPTVRNVRIAGKNMTRSLRELTGRFVDGLQGMKPLKAMFCESQLMELLEEENLSLQKMQEKRVLNKWLLKSAAEPIIVISLAVGIYGATELSLVKAASFIIMAFLFVRTVNQMSALQQIFQALGDTESAFTALHDTIEDAGDAREDLGGSLSQELKDSISLEGVGFSFKEKTVLKCIDMRVPVRSVTLLTGSSGSGKSTVSDIILGLFRPDAGSILVDGVDLRDMDLASWRAQIGYVPQDLFLFHDDLRSNVTLGNPIYADSDVIDALRHAGAWDFVKTLDDGLDTHLGERGQRLSGGQRQRISIARALIRNPRLLILDEATSALDDKTAGEIYETISKLAKEIAILVISHDDKASSIAERTYRIDDGRAHLVPH